MRAKNKSFLEDTFILLIIGIIIYSIYIFFFSEESKDEIESNKTIVEKTIKSIMPEEVIDKKPIIEETKKEEEISSEKIEEKKLNIIEKEIVNKKEAIIEEKIKVKEIEKPVEKENTETTDLGIFYENIEKRIYSNITKNINKNLLKDKNSVNIRITILKSGKYEQLVFIEGDKNTFELVKPSILEVFPLKINDTLKENFPRYFRMKIETK